MQVSVAPILDLGNVSFDLSRNLWATQGFRCAVAGSSGSGKSYLMAVFAEEIHSLGLPFVVIDPEGEHRSLCDLGSVARVGARDADIPFGSHWIDVSLGVLAQGLGLIIDLSEFPEDDWQLEYAWFTRRFFKMWRDDPRPVFFFLEEAHLFAPQKGVRRVAESLSITKQIARRGRKFGINWIFGSQRPGDLEKDVLAQANARFIGRIEILADYEAVRPYLPSAVGMLSFRDLDAGEFFLSIRGEFNRIQIRERRTRDLGSTPTVEYVQRDFLDVYQAIERAEAQLK